ncbi:MAG: cobalamin-dependent protein, partial [Acetobacterium sp.]|nr:cobalamin-dependent protein [Acetobacterium sp.]
MKVALVHISAGVDATPASPVIDHLGMEMLSGALASAGYSPVQFDSLLQGLSATMLVEAILKEEPGIVACSMNYANWSQSLQLLKEIKAADSSVFCVAGGYYATFHWDSILLNECCDCCIIGEGERPLVQLCDAVSKRLPLDGIAGAALRRDGRPACNSPARTDLNCWSLRADRQLLPLLERFPDGSRKIALERSRGCYHNCAFCSIAAQQGLSGQAARRRVRDADDLVDEMRILQSRSSIRDYWFMDATFLGPAGGKHQDLELAKKLTQINDGYMNLEIDTRADTIN